jgi:hypothetical protein
MASPLKRLVQLHLYNCHVFPLKFKSFLPDLLPPIRVKVYNKGCSAFDHEVNQEVL